MNNDNQAVTDTAEETMYAYWLHALSGASPAQARKLYEHTGSFKKIWEMDKAALLLSGLAIPEETAGWMIASKNADTLADSYGRLSEDGITFVHLGLPSYPYELKNIYDPPLGLFVKGNLHSSGKRCAAIVGARRCSEYGAHFAKEISLRLCRAGFGIVSGLALGIDVAAQSVASFQGYYSCAVLGCGVDICYPRENNKVYEKLIENGAVVSEFVPGTPPVSTNFPRRNRIISGMCHAVIIIEAKERSGSLITADMALEQGRDVYALPGRIMDPLSDGTNRLIKQGAGIILSPEDLIRELTAGDMPARSKKESEDSFQMNLIQCLDLNPAEKAVYDLLGFDPVSANVIQNKTKLEAGMMSSALTKLTIRGLIKQENGMYVKAFH